MEMEQKMREVRENREIQKLVKQRGNEKGRTMTFDFDGKPLAVAGIKLEKLPPSQWPVK